VPPTGGTPLSRFHSYLRRYPTNTTALFYRDRARQAESDTLDNVRGRWLRAAKAWDEMASRAEKTAERRSTNEEAKHLAEMDASEDD
jgi:Skp family chaperone for outer membrane proteins